MAKSPAEVAAKWSRNLSNSTSDITAGVQRVTEAPGAAAVKKQAKLKQNFNAAVDSGKWARNTGAVSLTDWQNATIQKGIPRVSQGAQAAIPKMDSFMQQLLPFQETASAKVRAMPDLTLQDNINRMVTFITEMSKFTKR